MSCKWVYTVGSELLESPNSPIEIKKPGGHLKFALLATNIRNAIDIAENKALDDRYLIDYIEAAERFDANHFDSDIHELLFTSIGRLEPKKNELDWVQTIVYD